MNDSNFFTVQEVANKLKITSQIVSKYIANKDLNAVKVNKSYRIFEGDLADFCVKTSFSEPEISYFKNPKICYLEYDGKNLNYDFFREVSGIFESEGDINSNLSNAIYYGDNYDVLNLLALQLEGKVDLIYIDPPYGTGQEFLDIDQNHAYSDKLKHSEFLEFIRKRLVLLKKMLSKKGSIYLHIDKKIGHYIKVLMDEVFGFDNFINDITRIKCNPKNFARNAYGNYSDMILFYAKERDCNIWNEVKEEHSDEKIKKLFPKIHPVFGRYTTHPLHAPGITNDGDTGKEWMGLMPPKGRHWRYGREELTRLNLLGLIEWSEKGNPRKIVYANEHKGTKVQDVWEYKDKGLSYSIYPTQKNYELLERIILNSSNPNSVVLDCFAGSGSTLLAAHNHNRKWIGIDNSLHAINVIKKSLIESGAKFNSYKYVDNQRN